MNKKSLIGGIAMSAIGIAALAHNGATGVTLERMNGMVALRGAMSELAPMMQGQRAYDVRAVQVAGATIMAHSGENMNKLFPQEEIAAASFAKPEIWENWEEFSALSEELRIYALGLSAVAPNGLTRPVQNQTPTDGAGAVDHSGMQMNDPVSEVAEGNGKQFSLDELMGVASPIDETRTTSISASPDGSAEPGGLDFSLMAAPQVFEMISGTCAACHSTFRSGS